MIHPAGMHTLNAVRLDDGQWQVSVQTDGHAANAFSIATNDRIDLALAELCARCDPPPAVPAVMRPPPV